MTIEVTAKSKITSKVQPKRKNSLKENLQQEIIKSSSICNLGTKTIKIIDLFAGIGGISLGFSQAVNELDCDCETVFASEIKKHAIYIYQDNFPEVNLANDITKIKATEIPDFDFLLAGFPCQAFSSAGNRLGFADLRGNLFFEVARIIEEKQPLGFLLENVDALLTHDQGKTFETIKTTLEKLDYRVNFQILDAQDFGLAQSRKRIYIVGTKKYQIDLTNFPITHNKLADVIETDVPATTDQFSEKLLACYCLADLAGKQIKDKRGGANNIHSWDFSLKGEVSSSEKELLELLLKQRRNKKWAEQIGIEWMDGMPLTKEMIATFYPVNNLQELLTDLVDKGYLVYEYPKQKVGKRRIPDSTLEPGYNIVTGKLSFQYNRILDPNLVTPTLVATDLSKLAVPVSNGLRKITIREGLRLFGFPENYQIKGITLNQAYDLLGNTVCVPVVKAVATRLLQPFKEEGFI